MRHFGISTSGNTQPSQPRALRIISRTDLSGVNRKAEKHDEQKDYYQDVAHQDRRALAFGLLVALPLMVFAVILFWIGMT